MGLDMYLHEKRYIPRYAGLAESNSGDYAKDFATANRILELADLHPKVDGGIHVEATVMYWRKANAIHKWFVDNVQDGVDDCDSYYVEKVQLEALRDVCKEIVADHSKAKDLLPPQEGFFFGSTDTDEWYFQDLAATVAGLDTVFEIANQEWPEFSYQSSW